jgi:Cu(I)/Ag(I) efflux system membrane fusion protein
MTMDYAAGETLDLSALPIGEETTLTFDRPDGMTMVLAAVEPVMAPMKVMGTINDINPESNMANITHGPMTDIGMPGMTMDFVIDPSIQPQDLPTGVEVSLLMTRNPDFSLTLVGIEIPAEQVTQ